MPNPQLEFNFSLAWSNLIRFQVKGKLIKDETIADKGALHSLDNADFQLYVLMEQGILAAISEAMQKWFASAQASVYEGIDAAKRNVDEAKVAFDKACQEAKRYVEETPQIFDAKMKAVQSDLLEKERLCERERVMNRKYIIAEELRAQSEIKETTNRLAEKQKASEDDMGEKTRTLASTRRDATTPSMKKLLTFRTSASLPKTALGMRLRHWSAQTNV